MKKTVYMTGNRTPLALTNLANPCTLAELQETIRKAKTGEELVEGLNDLDILYTFRIVEENDKKVKLEGTNLAGDFGGYQFLICFK